MLVEFFLQAGYYNTALKLATHSEIEVCIYVNLATHSEIEVCIYVNLATHSE